MKLKYLKIAFQEPTDFFAEIDNAILSKRSINTRAQNILTFASEKMFNNFMTVNKLQILRAISQQKPDSVYQLALLLGREPNHMLKDCRQLESFKFINLEETDSNRKSLKPVLSFDYDVIRCDSAIIAPYTISERAESLLLGKTAN